MVVNKKWGKRFDEKAFSVSPAGTRPFPAVEVGIVSLHLNQLDGLENTLRSVRSQSYPVKRHLVVDSSSVELRDKVRELVTSWGGLYCWEPASGIYPAMRNGFQRMITEVELCVFLNSEDVFLGPLSLQKLVKAVNRTNGHWAVGGILLSDEDSTTVYNPFGKIRVSENDLCSNMGWFPHPSTIYRVASLSSVEPFEDRLQIAADHATNLRFFSKFGAPTTLPATISIHRLGGISSTRKLRSRLETSLARITHFGPQQIWREIKFYWRKLIARSKAKARKLR